MEIGIFIPHCHDDHCNLGSFDYKCPICRRNIMDLDIWWESDSIHSGSIFWKKCEYCDGNIKIFYNEYDFTYYIDTGLPNT